MKALTAVAVVVLVAGLCGEASAEPLYLATGSSPTALYEVNIVDADTANATWIMDFSGDFPAIALSGDGEILVGVQRTGPGNPSKVVGVDLTAAPLTEVELCILPAPFGGEVVQLAFDPAGVLWGTNQFTNHLFSIDVSPGPGNSCNVNDRGSISGATTQGGDIAFDEQGTLFLVTNFGGGTPQVYTVNPTTAVATHIGSSPAINPNPGMAFTADGQLVVTDLGNSFLFFVDTANGGGTGGPELIDTSDNSPLQVAGGDLASSVSFPTAAEVLQQIQGQLQNLVDANPSAPWASKLRDAIAKLDTALEELAKTPPDNQAAAGNMEGAVGELEAAVKEGLDPAVGNAIMDAIAGVARQMATDAIAAAEAGGGSPSKITEAEQYLAEGDALRAAGKFKDAVNKYKDALAKAESA